jgi:hypothetical protein
VDEVHRPAFIGPRYEHRGDWAYGAELPAPASLHREAGSAIDAVYTLAIRLEALAPKDGVHAAVAEARALFGNLVEPGDELRVFDLP